MKLKVRLSIRLNYLDFVMYYGIWVPFRTSSSLERKFKFISACMSLERKFKSISARLFICTKLGQMLTIFLNSIDPMIRFQYDSNASLVAKQTCVCRIYLRK